MVRKIVLAGVGLFVAFTVAMNVVSAYAENCSVGIRGRERVRSWIDWYPLAVWGKPR